MQVSEGEKGNGPFAAALIFLLLQFGEIHEVSGRRKHARKRTVAEGCFLLDTTVACCACSWGLRVGVSRRGRAMAVAAARVALREQGLYVGTASGHGHNCLIDSLLQCLSRASLLPCRSREGRRVEGGHCCDAEATSCSPRTGANTSVRARPPGSSVAMRESFGRRSVLEATSHSCRARDTRTYGDAWCGGTASLEAVRPHPGAMDKHAFGHGAVEASLHLFNSSNQYELVFHAGVELQFESRAGSVSGNARGCVWDGPTCTSRWSRTFEIRQQLRKQRRKTMQSRRQSWNAFTKSACQMLAQEIRSCKPSVPLRISVMQMGVRKQRSTVSSFGASSQRRTILPLYRHGRGYGQGVEGGLRELLKVLWGGWRRI